MEKEHASRRFEEPRRFWDYVVFIMGITLIGALLGVLYSTIIAATLMHLTPKEFIIRLSALGTLGLLAIAPSALFLGLSLTLLPSSLRKRRMAIAIIILAAGLLGSYLFQTVRPFDFYHETNGSRPGWEPFILLSLTTAIALLTSLGVVSSLSLLTRNFTL
jgi:hypothetical protein